MEQLIELLKQIQELAGVAIEALQGAAGGEQGGEPPAEGAPPPKGQPPAEGAPPPKGQPPAE